MAAIFQASRAGEPDVAKATGDAGWRIADDMLVAGTDVAGDAVAVPGEQVLLLAVDLPIANPRRRLEALPFAVEDRIADPLDAVHLAIGPAIGPQRYLVGVVRHEVMRRWIDLAEGAGLGHAALVPDALLLPRPPDGCWTIRGDAGRSLIRAADGTGFAIATPALLAAWQAGGRPPCIADGGPLPAELTIAEGAAALAEIGRPPLDLRQGRYAPRRAPRARTMRRRMLAVAGLGLVAHAAIAAADTLALRRLADRREAEARALVAPLAPTMMAGDDPAVAAAPLLAAAGRGGAPDRLLPLLARASAALAPAGPVALRGLSYDRAAGRLVLEVEPGAEARLAGLLGGAGLRATGGGGRVTITDGGA